MSERVLWLRLCVTGPTPECGEIVGLRIVDRQAHRTVFDAFFHPVREDGWKSVPAGGVNVDLSSRLPLNIYVDGIERILSGATLLRGEHVARDIRFLRAAGVHLEDQVVARSVMAERHKRLASGIAVPRAPGTGLAGPSRWGEKTHPLPETNPSTTHLQRKERTRNANPTSACGSWRPQRIDAPRRPRKRRRGRTHTRRHRSRRRARCRTRALRRTARRP